MRVIVIIPAAGSGTRFGSELPKQFHDLAGKPVLQHAIDRFVDDARVDRVVVALAEEHLARVSIPRVDVVAGGRTRQESVMLALATTPEEEALIAVHDAVRPFFRTATFHAVLDAAEHWGSALPALAVTETIHSTRGDELESTLDRSRLVAAQTPQCFRRSILRQILENAKRDSIDGTDEAGLAVRYGFPVHVIPGDPENVKITRVEDLKQVRSRL